MEYPETFEGNPPASDSEIQSFKEKSKICLPQPFVLFLKTMNGGEGFVGPNYVVVFPVEKLLEYNRAYGFYEYAPDLFLFGSNGGGEAFAFDRRHTAWPVVMLPFISLETQQAVIVSNTFESFFDVALSRDLTEMI